MGCSGNIRLQESPHIAKRACHLQAQPVHDTTIVNAFRGRPAGQGEKNQECYVREDRATVSSDRRTHWQPRAHGFVRCKRDIISSHDHAGTNVFQMQEPGP